MHESIFSLTSVFKQHRWPAITTFICGICGAIAYLAITPPKNQATVRLVLSDKQLSVAKNDRDRTNKVGCLAALPNQQFFPSGNRLLMESEA